MNIWKLILIYNATNFYCNTIHLHELFDLSLSGQRKESVQKDNRKTLLPITAKHQIPYFTKKANRKL